MKATSPRARLVIDTLRQYPELPIQTIAKFILAHHGPMFDNKLENIRMQLRYYTGTMGGHNKKLVCKEKLVVRDRVSMPVTWAVVRERYHLPPGRWLLINDVHVPFHEIRAVEAALDYAKGQRIGGIFMNGDIWDMASASYWPSVPRDFDDECRLFLDFLDYLIQEFPRAKIVYKPGNHEYRLPRLFQNKMPELSRSPLANLETILGFDVRGIEFLEYFQIVMAGELPVLHGHEVSNIQRSVNPARGLFQRTKTFALCGHCHTTSQHTERDLLGHLISTWSVGCLCNLEPEYRPYGNNWNWGFAIVTIDDKGKFEVANMRILPHSYEVVK